MKIIDLTHSISPDMPVYPGTETPVFETAGSIDVTGFVEKKITLYSHTGTHIDAPAHLIKGAKTLDLLTVEHFYGRTLLLNRAGVRSIVIDIRELAPLEEAIQETDFFMIHTGWSRHWGREKYFSGYPVLSREAADWLSGFRLKGFGLDTISADEADSKDFPVHKAFLQKDIIIIENLANLEKLPGDQFFFSCFPLRFQDADGSPVRAVAYC